MFKTETIYQIVPFLLGAFVGFFIKNLITPYLNEKGKNLATKQDVEEITKKIESVKSTFSKEVEVLKVDLQTKMGYNAEVKKALIDYYKQTTAWVNMLTSPTFEGKISLTDEERLSHPAIITKNYDEIRNATSMLRLYLKDEDILNAAESLLEITFQNALQIRLNYYAEIATLNRSDPNFKHHEYMFQSKFLNDLKKSKRDIEKKGEEFSSICRQFIKSLALNSN